MKRMLFILTLLLIVPGTLHAQENRLSPQQINDIANRVVLIVSLRGGQPLGHGSGTIVHPTGQIFTNAHVVEGGQDFMVWMLEDINELPVHRYFASVTGVSDTLDFAIMQIDRDADGRRIDASTLDLPFMSTESLEMGRGDDIWVFGFPGIGDGYLVLTQGSITTIENGQVGTTRMPVWYQTDAEISPGNSGGLVVNGGGRMVGIPTAVQTEGTTGGRLGGILPITAILATLELARTPTQAQGGSSQPVQTGQLSYTLPPAFGSLQLAAGFLPDPLTVPMQVGGSVNAGTLSLGEGCLGFVNPAPDYRIQWSGSAGLLRLFFVGAADTTLLVNDPQGRWFCSDDSFATSHPAIDLGTAVAGQYDIWVGSYNPTTVQGTLYITEQAAITPASVAP